MVLTLNAGSSSLKFALFDLEAASAPLLEGIYERLGASDASMRLGICPAGLDTPGFTGAHAEAFEHLGTLLSTWRPDLEISAVGHRVVHGGERFRASVLISQEVEATIEALSPLAPLHNPANLLGIRFAQQAFPEARHIAVFDTAFHANLPEYAYRYPVPEAWYKDYGVRKYGFHGTSHAYVSARAIGFLAKVGLSHARMITLHLGNGCSATAIRDGVSIDTSMGLTPLAGLMMGTRPGDLDPGLGSFLLSVGLQQQEIDQALQRNSGLIGIAGENDMRTLLRLRENGTAEQAAQAALAIRMFVYRIKSTIGAYATILGGLDALIFTGGIGEHATQVRKEICEGLGWMGIELDQTANESPFSALRSIGKGPVAICVVATNEEWAIAHAASQIASAENA